jgi:holliday junction DNA helicase RuvA
MPTTSTPAPDTITLQTIAQKLRSYARELAAQGNQMYRVRAYRRAALAVMGLSMSTEQLTTPAEWSRVLGVGESLAQTLATYAATGEWLPSRA